MFSSLTTKLALKKAGLPTDLLNFSGPLTTSTSPTKLRKNQPDNIDQDDGNGGWTNWMSVKSLPLTAQAWLSPPPPPVAIGRVPGIGDKAPVDKSGKIMFGEKKRILLVFLRCVGCACMYSPLRRGNLANNTLSRTKDLSQSPNPCESLQRHKMHRSLALFRTSHKEMDRPLGRSVERTNRH